MEYLLRIVFSVFAVAALLHRVAAAQARKAAKPTEGESAPRKPRPSIPKSTPASAAAPQRQQTQKYFEKRTMRNIPQAQPQIPTPGSAADTGSASIRSMQTTGATASSNETNKRSTEAFDLRTAILYSEILKPKFDE